MVDSVPYTPPKMVTLPTWYEVMKETRTQPLHPTLCCCQTAECIMVMTGPVTECS